MKLNLMGAAVLIAVAPMLAHGQAAAVGSNPEPIKYGMVIDTTKSLDWQFKQGIELAKSVVTKNKLNDQTFIIRFVDRSRIEIVQEFTSDQEVLVNGLSKLTTELGQSAVTDAVYLSIEKIANESKNDKRPPALIVITDGEDRNSYHEQNQLFQLLRKKKVKVVAIGLVNGQGYQGNGARKRAIKFLERLAAESGGRVFFPTTFDEISGMAGVIVEELRRP